MQKKKDARAKGGQVLEHVEYQRWVVCTTRSPVRIIINMKDVRGSLGKKVSVPGQSRRKRLAASSKDRQIGSY